MPAADLLAELRAVKDPEELEIMIAAQRIAEKALTDILNEIRPGVTEKEIAARLQYRMLHLGASDMSFDPIVVSGANGSLPHGVPSEKTIQDGEFVTMDFGCVYRGYCSDMTRTVALGEPSEEMKKVYYTVLEAQKAGIAAAKAGCGAATSTTQRPRSSRTPATESTSATASDTAWALRSTRSPNANHSNQDPMPEGVAVSAEPGIYLPGKIRRAHRGCDPSHPGWVRRHHPGAERAHRSVKTENPCKYGDNGVK